MKENILIAESRKEVGGKTGRRFRRQGWLPAVVNNEKGEARLVKLNLHEFEQRLRHHTGENLVLDMSIDGGSPVKVLLREVQHDGLTDRILHADFVEISMTRKMRVRVAVVLQGDPVGVISEGGIMEQLLRDVEIECLPADIPEAIYVDVSGLHLGKRIAVSDLPIDKTRITVLTPKDVAIAAIIAPQEEEVAAAPAEGAEAAAAEPEVIGKGKEEEEEVEKAEEKDKKGSEKAEKTAEPKSAEAKQAAKEKTTKEKK